jgi:hypothetical protein
MDKPTQTRFMADVDSMLDVYERERREGLAVKTVDERLACVYKRFKRFAYCEEAERDFIVDRMQEIVSIFIELGPGRSPAAKGEYAIIDFETGEGKNALRM